ncbi:MAG: DUF99 family protein [Nitrososphaeraceae archaeon]
MLLYTDGIKLRRLHVDKKGIRVLGLAESFNQKDLSSNWSGIVMRRDLVVDGVSFGSSTIEGNDATDNIVNMWKKLDRNDIGCIFLDGLVVSMYNIIDGRSICEITGLPVVAITFRDSKGLEGSIRYHFCTQSTDRIRRYNMLGDREPVLLKTGKKIFIRYWGSSYEIVTTLLNSFTLQGSIPEPIRLAKLIARESGRYFMKMQNKSHY